MQILLQILFCNQSLKKLFRWIQLKLLYIGKLNEEKISAEFQVGLLSLCILTFIYLPVFRLYLRRKMYLCFTLEYRYSLYYISNTKYAKTPPHKLFAVRRQKKPHTKTTTTTTLWSICCLEMPSNLTINYCRIIFDSGSTK